MTPLPEVEELVEAARAGDAAAWDALVDRFLPLVTAVIRRLRLSPADADDVNQTVWLRLVEHLDRLREPGRCPAGWPRPPATRGCARSGGGLATCPSTPAAPPSTSPRSPTRARRWSRTSSRTPCARRCWSSRRSVGSCCSCCWPTHRVLRRDQCPTGDPRGSIGPTRARALEQLRELSGAARLGRRRARAPRRCFRCLPRLTTTGSWRSWPERWDRWPPCPIIDGRRPGPRSRGAPSTRSCWP